MSSDYVPFKLVEVNILSAQNLPAVSKVLRTFAVAWIHPDQKLSTRIDHQGHTNPTWNYKLVFRVDKKLLRNESAAVTIEIYNVAWLRDLPIGTAHLFINHISPPLIPNSPNRSVGLHIRRPSGHLQGILHVGVSLIDNGISDSPLRSEISAFTNENQVMDRNVHQNVQEDSTIEKTQEKVDLKDFLIQDHPFMKKIEDLASSKQESNNLKNRMGLMLRTKSKASTNLSLGTVMHPLPSEIAENLKKGFYTTECDDYGSSIFENWSEPSHHFSLRSKNVEKRTEEQIPLTIDYEGLIAQNHHEGHKLKDQEGHKAARPKRRRRSDGGGLFSCFLRGFEFTFVCGSKDMKKERDKIRRHHKVHVNH